MKKHIRIGVVIAAVICTTFGIINLLSGSANAIIDGTKVWVLGEKPVRVEDLMEVGDSFSNTIEIRNNNDEKVTVSLTPAPFSYGSADDYNPDYTTRKPRTQLADWIVLPGGSEYDIDSGQTISVKYEFTVPDGAVAGSQSAAILIHTMSTGGSDGQSSMGTSVETSFAYVILANVDGEALRENGEVLKWHTASFVFEKPEIKVESVIENAGNVSFMSEYDLKISDFFNSNNVVFENSRKVDVLPDSGRNVSHIWDKAPSIGLFNVEESISFLGKTEVFKKVVIVFPIWLLIIVIAIIIMLVTALIMKIRKHRKENKST